MSEVMTKNVKSINIVEKVRSVGKVLSVLCNRTAAWHYPTSQKP